MAAGWEEWVEDDARLPLALSFFFGGEPLSIWVMLQQLYRGRAPCAGSQADLIFSASNTLCRTPCRNRAEWEEEWKTRAVRFLFFFGLHSIFSRQQITRIATKTSCCCLGRISDDPPSAFLTLRDRHRYARQIAGLPPPILSSDSLSSSSCKGSTQRDKCLV